VNKWLFKLHSWLALAVFLPLLVICVTGSILVFKHEIDGLLMPDKVRVAEVRSQRLPLDSLLARVNTRYPGHEAVGWALFRDPGRSDLVYLMERGTSDWSYTLLDQYTGDILAPVRSTTHYLTDWLLELHFTFLLADAGLIPATVVAVVLCLLGITGLILHRKFWKNFFTLRWKSRLIVYFSDLHKMVGVIASPILLVAGFTGAWWNVSEVLHEMEAHADGAGHYVMTGRLYNDGLSLSALAADARSRIDGFQPTYITLPYEPGVDITFFGAVPTGNPLLSQYASSVSYDARSGQYRGALDIREAGFGAKALDSYRRLHFGNFAGLASRILWCLAGLAPLLLAGTGLTLWWLRRPKRRAAKEKEKLRQRQLLAN
jgi:uncharacterized iron-regulated membrane protein